MAQRTSCLVFVLALVACGSGDAGDKDSTTLFVDAAAATGGDGSIDEPFQTVREALESGRTVSILAVAGGTYEVPAWIFDAPLIVQGALRSPTVLIAEAGADRIVWGAADGAGLLLVRELGFESALEFSRGQIELRTITVTDATAPAIHLRDAAAALFGVDVRDVAGQPTAGDGVLVAGGTFTWTDGSVTRAPDRALVVDNASASLDGLTLSSDNRAALTINSGADVTASDIAISDVAMGVYVVDASIVLDNATITGAQSTALFVSEGASVTVTNSTFSDCPQGHVTHLGNGVELTLDGNQLSNATAGQCVSIGPSDGTFVLRNNVLDTCAGNGINLSNVTGAVVENNTIRNILPDPLFSELGEGITAIDSTVTLSKNKLSAIHGTGLQLIRGAVTVDDNTITDTGSAGISSVEPGGSRLLITNNTITRATGAGILILDSDADLTGNTVDQTAFHAATGLGDGITFSLGASVNVVGNTSSNNAGNGIMFHDGVSGEVRGNTATGNTQYGILEICSGAASSVTVGTNTLSGNAVADERLCP